MGINSVVDPLTLDKVRSHLQVDYDEDDTLIQTYITNSLHFVQNYIGKNVAAYENDETFQEWVSPMYLEWSEEVRSGSLEYTDDLGAVQSVAVTVGVDNVIVTDEIPGDYNGGAVTVSYVPYVYQFQVPVYEQIRLLIIGDWYTNRETNIVGAQVHELPMGTKIMMDSVKTGRV